MDNFKRYRPVAGRSKSVDGFARSTAPRQSPSHAKLQRGSAYQPETVDGVRPRRKVGDFNSPDGFYPVDRVHQRHLQENMQHTSNNHAPHTADPVATGRRPQRTSSGKIKHDFVPPPKAKKRRFSRIRNLFVFNPFRPSNWTKKRAFANLLVLFILISTFLGGKFWFKLNDVFQGGGGAAALQENVDPAELRGEGDGRVNILLLGRGGEGHEGPDLTDTIVIASINPIQKEAALLSIPRDLYVRSPNGGYTKINEVFANAKNRSLANVAIKTDESRKVAEAAGFKAVEDMISDKIGLPIHYHAIVDFVGFQKAINTVGGVTVNVPETGAVYENMWLEGRNYSLNVQPGQQKFDGLRALAYSRSRKTSARGDFDRSERQRMIMVALKDKIFSAGTYGNPLKVSQLMSDFGGHIRTNLSVQEVMRLYEIGQQIPSNKISSVDLVTAPNDHIVGSMMNGLSVQIPRAGLDDYSEVKNFVRNRLKDGYLADENATVAIYNGTMIPGLAGRTSKDLKSYGYKISTAGDAPTKGVQKTIVVDLRAGAKKYTKRYLENRFGTQVVTSVPDAKIVPGNADFVIILGQNEQTRLAN